MLLDFVVFDHNDNEIDGCKELIQIIDNRDEEALGEYLTKIRAHIKWKHSFTIKVGSINSHL